MEHVLTPQELNDAVTAKADSAWLQLRKAYPRLNHFPRPLVKYNKRLKTTAGRAFYDSNPTYIDLSVELLWEHTASMLADTLPHELAHIAAFIIFGDAGHGAGWKAIMASLNIPATRCHHMINSKHEAKRMLRNIP